MKNDSTTILKEQLRIKEAELQRVRTQAEKSEKKKDFILKISREKIQSHTLLNGTSDLEENLEIDAEGKSEADDKSKEIDNLLTETKLKLDESEKEKKEIKRKLVRAVKFIKSQNSSQTGNNTENETASEDDEDEKTPKVVKAVKVLNVENQSLRDELEALKVASSEQEARKELLENEVKRVREQLDTNKSSEQNNAEQIKSNQDTIDKYKSIIKEKNKVLKELQNSLSGKKKDDSGSEPDSEPNFDNADSIKDKLKDLISQKDEADKKFNNLKSVFDKKLKAEKESFEEELKKQLKKQKNQKDSNDDADEEEEGAPAWMVTFADMVTLVLCFFILMYAIASQNVSKFKAEILGTETKSVGVLELLDSMTIRKRLTDLTAKRPDSVISDIKAVTKEAPVDVEITKDNIILRIPGQVLFKQGGADLRLEARSSLDSVINVANRYPDYKINIQGHTDDYPISTERFPSNWELSSARATAVLRYFIDKGAEPERMTATGYADTFPLFSNDTKAGQLRNRRVEVILEKES